MTDHEEAPRDVGPWTLYPLQPENEHEGSGEAFVYGDLEAMAQDERGVLMRPHSRCLFGDVFGSQECDCGPQRDAAQAAIMAAGSGIFFYLTGQEGRGAGLLAKMRGYALTQQLGVSSGDAYRMQDLPVDQRQYGHVARFLVAHQIGRVRIMTNSPAKIEPLEAAGIVCIRVPLVVGVTDHNRSYLEWKQKEMGHMLGGLATHNEE